MSNKKEERIIFPDTEIAGIKIKPWSFGNLFDVADILAVIIDKAEERGVIKSFEESGILKYTTMVKLFGLANKEILNIMAKTLDVEEDVLRKLSIEDGVKIALTIFEQNKNTITGAVKNVLSVPQEKELEE